MRSLHYIYSNSQIMCSRQLFICEEQPSEKKCILSSYRCTTYVDDIFIAGTDLQEVMKRIKEQFTDHYEMKERMHELNYYLGINNNEITRTDNDFNKLDQAGYVRNLCARYWRSTSACCADWTRREPTHR